MTSDVTFSINDNSLTISLSGHIDSANAAEIDAKVKAFCAENPADNVVIDCNDLEYISSAGLRIILRLRKEYQSLKVVNVSSEVYEILDITGFTEMMEVVKAYRVVSVDGCEVIGQGANGKVYRIDPDTIVKVFINPDSLDDIQRERELARKAFVLGVPTAISYDVVRVGNSYGSVYELLNAESLAKVLTSSPDKLEDVAKISVDLLKKIHATVVKKGDMPDMKAIAVKWAEFLREYLPKDAGDKLVSLVSAVPDSDNMLHGDYHIKNVMIQNGESLLIDMDTICVGNPIFEFGSIFNAYQGFSDVDHKDIESFLGITYETGAKLWKRILQLYFDGVSEAELDIIEAKAQLIGFTRIMRRTIRRNALSTPEGVKEVDHYRQKIIDLLSKVDSLAL